MQEKTCRRCTYFRYHRFAGFCGKEFRDTKSCWGECEPCDKFEKASNEEYQRLLDYENNILKPYFNL